LPCFQASAGGGLPMTPQHFSFNAAWIRPFVAELREDLSIQCLKRQLVHPRRRGRSRRRGISYKKAGQCPAFFDQQRSACKDA
jgi:hypothetical protein